MQTIFVLPHKITEMSHVLEIYLILSGSGTFSFSAPEHVKAFQLRES